MAQGIRNRKLARVRRLRGQVEALERALEADVDAPAVLMLLAAVRGAANSLTAEVLEDHIRKSVLGVASDQERAKGAADIVDAVRTYLR